MTSPVMSLVGMSYYQEGGIKKDWLPPPLNKNSRTRDEQRRTEAEGEQRQCESATGLLSCSQAYCSRLNDSPTTKQCLFVTRGTFNVPHLFHKKIFLLAHYN